MTQDSGRAVSPPSPIPELCPPVTGLVCARQSTALGAAPSIAFLSVGSSCLLPLTEQSVFTLDLVTDTQVSCRGSLLGSSHLARFPYLSLSRLL